MPGFVNAHTHLELSCFPEWLQRLGPSSPPTDFVDWIRELIRVKQTISQKELADSLQRGIQLSLAAGTTSVGDIVTEPALLPHYQGVPLSARLFLELLGQERTSFTARIQTATAALDNLHEPIRAGLSPHAPYTIHRDLLPEITVAAHRRQLPLAIHLAESAAETELFYHGSGSFADRLYPLAGWQQHLSQFDGQSATEVIAHAGLLSPRCLAVHGVQLNHTDLQILKQHNCALCLCPRSNAKLHVGTAPVSHFKQHGLHLCLGTDSLASNDSLSMWDELRFAELSYQGILDHEELLCMATIHGATALGLADLTGSITRGKRADLQVVRIDGHCTPKQLIHSAQPIATIIAGSLVQH